MEELGGVAGAAAGGLGGAEVAVDGAAVVKPRGLVEAHEGNTAVGPFGQGLSDREGFLVVLEVALPPDVHLSQVVGADGAVACIACVAQGGQEHRDQNGDDGNADQDFKK